MMEIRHSTKSASGFRAGLRFEPACPRLGGLNPVYRWEFVVGPEAVDGNGHVNNVAYVQWMQEVAIRHSDATGCSALTLKLGAAWVVRRHQIEYHRACFAGDRLTALTWVVDFRRVFSRRRYRFYRQGEPTPVVSAETDWVFIDTRTQRARAIPEAISEVFQVLGPEDEPRVNPV
jgi:acyl-CoA thioester hydrolase